MSSWTAFSTRTPTSSTTSEGKIMTQNSSGASPKPGAPVIIDCDIHNVIWPGALDPFLSQRWREHHNTYGGRSYTGATYPKGAPEAARADAWPPSGRLPGADLGFMQEQHLDPMNVEYGILNCLGPASAQLNSEYSAALATATNEWQVAEWFEKDERLRGGITVPTEYGSLAKAEIERQAGVDGFVQVLLAARTAEPLGRPKYWPMYEAAQEAGL